MHFDACIAATPLERWNYMTSSEYHDTVVSNQRQLPISPDLYIVGGHTEFSNGGSKSFHPGRSVLVMFCLLFFFSRQRIL